jgi:hypothetical protein
MFGAILQQKCGVPVVLTHIYKKGDAFAPPQIFSGLLNRHRYG